MANSGVGCSPSMSMFGRWTQEFSEFVVLWTGDSPGGADSYNTWVVTEAARQDAAANRCQPNPSSLPGCGRPTRKLQQAAQPSLAVCRTLWRWSPRAFRQGCLGYREPSARPRKSSFTLDRTLSETTRS